MLIPPIKGIGSTFSVLPFFITVLQINLWTKKQGIFSYILKLSLWTMIWDIKPVLQTCSPFTVMSSHVFMPYCHRLYTHLLHNKQNHNLLAVPYVETVLFCPLTSNLSSCHKWIIFASSLKQFLVIGSLNYQSVSWFISLYHISALSIDNVSDLVEIHFFPR